MSVIEEVKTTPAFKRLISKITKETLWLYVIDVLKEKPLYAYAVRVAIRQKYGFKVATVTVYTVLYRMRREGLLETFEEGGTTYYKPSEKGLKAYETALNFLETLVKVFKGEEKSEKLKPYWT